MCNIYPLVAYHSYQLCSIVKKYQLKMKLIILSHAGILDSSSEQHHRHYTLSSLLSSKLSINHPCFRVEKKSFAYLKMNFHQTRDDVSAIRALRGAIIRWREALLSSWQPQSEWYDNGHALYLLLLDVHVALLWPIKGGICFFSSHPWAGTSIGSSDLKLSSRFQMMINAVCDTAGAICTACFYFKANANHILWCIAVGDFLFININTFF